MLLYLGRDRGLYLSNALKHQLRHKINILVLDNHCNERHFKTVFKALAIRSSYEVLDKYFDPNIRKLANSFGKDGCIGLPINFIEVLLLISAKELGVNFYFDQNLDFSVLNNSLVDLVFDALEKNTKYKTRRTNGARNNTPNTKH